jgi:DNA-binding CsgD family transcriptional regulator
VFLLFEDPRGRRHVHELGPDPPRLTIGRRPSCDVALPWDEAVSRVHAELLWMGADWVICDDGLSHNGTFVNGERVLGRRRLAAGDVVQVGSCALSVCEDEPSATAPPTRPARPGGDVRRVTAAQRRLLESLCRPVLERAGSAPASNREIADELGISVDTVKGTLGALFERFELTTLPQNAKRAELAARALDILSPDPPILGGPRVSGSRSG